MGVISIRKPSDSSVTRFVNVQASLDFSYSAVGATAHTPPAGYVVDRTCVELGAGNSVFELATNALKKWKPFQLGWVEPCSTSIPIQAGQCVAITTWAAGVWWLNACRIVYTVDESRPHPRFGFAYGTLPGHVESGEERFLIEWDRESDRVRYEILAFSRPNYFVTRLGYPLVRRSQRRFGRDSATAMFRAVGQDSRKPVILQSTA